jgi:hypothetical protein
MPLLPDTADGSRRSVPLPVPPLGMSGEQPCHDDGPGVGPPEALVLDIGGDIGALIVFTDETCLGKEIDLTPAGVPRSHHVHTMVRRRRAVARDVVAGVYPHVPQGIYTVWGLEGTGPLGRVAVAGGRVSEFWAGNCRGQKGRRP